MRGGDHCTTDVILSLQLKMVNFALCIFTHTHTHHSPFPTKINFASPFSQDPRAPSGFCAVGARRGTGLGRPQPPGRARSERPGAPLQVPQPGLRTPLLLLESALCPLAPRSRAQGTRKGQGWGQGPRRVLSQPCGQSGAGLPRRRPEAGTPAPAPHSRPAPSAALSPPRAPSRPAAPRPIRAPGGRAAAAAGHRGCAESSSFVPLGR